ncbi:hypothetical protein GF336_05690 [Candidatus Woesearchaeota archaeon]|nr:hypothetical protein [Candidatus Woesearchaeota archaeon]
MINFSRYLLVILIAFTFSANLLSGDEKEKKKNPNAGTYGFWLSGGYDTRLQDLLSGGMYYEMESESKIYFGGGVGSLLMKDIASDAEDEVESFGVDADTSVISWSVWGSYVFSVGAFAGMGISGSSIEAEVKNSGYTVTGEHKPISVDIFAGYAILDKSSFYLDLRLGYGISAGGTELELSENATNSSMTSDIGNPLNNVYFSLGLGYTF